MYVLGAILLKPVTHGRNPKGHVGMLVTGLKSTETSSVMEPHTNLCGRNPKELWKLTVMGAAIYSTVKCKAVIQ